MTINTLGLIIKINLGMEIRVLDIDFFAHKVTAIYHFPYFSLKISALLLDIIKNIADTIAAIPIL